MLSAYLKTGSWGISRQVILYIPWVILQYWRCGLDHLDDGYHVTPTKRKSKFGFYRRSRGRSLRESQYNIYRWKRRCAGSPSGKRRGKRYRFPLQTTGYPYEPWKTQICAESGIPYSPGFGSEENGGRTADWEAEVPVLWLRRKEYWDSILRPKRWFSIVHPEWPWEEVLEHTGWDLNLGLKNRDNETSDSTGTSHDTKIRSHGFGPKCQKKWQIFTVSYPIQFFRKFSYFTQDLKPLKFSRT